MEPLAFSNAAHHAVPGGKQKQFTKMTSPEVQKKSRCLFGILEMIAEPLRPNGQAAAFTWELLSYCFLKKRSFCKREIISILKKNCPKE